MKRWTILLYGLVNYAIFLGVFLYAIGFLGNLGVSNSIDAQPHSSLGFALSINLILLTVFAVQHSLMARPFFKKWLTNYIPEPAERATYVLASNAAMIGWFLFWQPLGYSIWTVTQPIAVIVIYAFFLQVGRPYLSPPAWSVISICSVSVRSG